MDAILTGLTDYVKRQGTAMHDALRRLVLIPSGTPTRPVSMPYAGRSWPLLESSAGEGGSCPGAVRRHADCLHAARRTGRRVSSSWAIWIRFSPPTRLPRWREDEENYYGPGVVDMKGGSLPASSP